MAQGFGCSRCVLRPRCADPLRSWATLVRCSVPLLCLRTPTPLIRADPWSERSSPKRHYVNEATQIVRWGRPVEGTGGKWTQLFDEDVGRSYFIEEGKAAGQGQWLLPAGVGDPVRIWIEVRTEDRGATYYFNPASGERSWVRPEPGVTAERTTAVLQKHERVASSASPSTGRGALGSTMVAPPRPVVTPQGGSAGERNAAFFQQQKQAKLEAAAEEKAKEDAKLAAMDPEQREAFLLGKQNKSVHDRRKTSAMKQLMRQSSRTSMGGGNPLKKRGGGKRLSGGRGSPRSVRGK